MRGFIMGLLCAAIVALGAAPAEAATLRTTYSSYWHAVSERHGADAAGRNIRRDDVKTKRGTRPARYAELARSIRILRRMLHPGSSLLTGAAPRQPPGGIETLRAPAGGTLAAIRACESGGNYSTNTGNGFYGAYQFTLGTWQSVGGSGNPAAASPAEQDRRAAMLYASRGAQPWPVCGR